MGPGGDLELGVAHESHVLAAFEGWGGGEGVVRPWGEVGVDFNEVGVP